MPTCVVVIPCYNEERRLDLESFAAFVAAHPDIRLLFVDDGSTDSTARVIESLCERSSGCVELLRLPENVGKAEAVRRGLLAACESSARYAGFWDADLATPLTEVPAFVALLEERRDIEMVFGARVKLLGRSIERRAARHYLGRVFATAASTMLRLAIYDTQCGAKMFRLSAEFEERLREPFIGGWIFDVEIIAREIRARRGSGLPPVSEIIYEYPLTTWQDVRGSKIALMDWFKVGGQLAHIYLKYLR